MARLYDTRTTIFSPKGRLYQVEYALQAINHASTCLGILATDGIVLAVEKYHNVLLENTESEKIYFINDDIVCAVAGISSDANVLTNEIRYIAQNFLLQNGETIPCEQLVSNICNIKQAYTQYGGNRPFGVSILYAGWDRHYGFQLYRSDPSGNYGGWKAVCTGHDYSSAMCDLNHEYKKDTITIKTAKPLVIKVLSKIMGTRTISQNNGWFI